MLFTNIVCTTDHVVSGFTDEYKLDVTKPNVTSAMNPKIVDKTNIIYQRHDGRNDETIYNNDHPHHAEWQAHQASYVEQQQISVPLQILSPITSICWMYMCPSWRKHLDFNFQRHHNGMTIHQCTNLITPGMSNITICLIGMILPC